MNRFTRLSVGILLAGSVTVATAADVGSLLKAQAILGQVTQIMDKYEDVQALLASNEIVLELAEPREDAEGKYVFPYTSYGAITEWAEKSLSAQAGAEVGAMAGDKAVGAIAGKVPFGGLASGMLKGKSKELAAVTAVGGWEFIRSSSDLSFDDQDDFSLYLHTQFEGSSDYETALAAAMAIYPELEKGHSRSIDAAYKKARKAARQ